MMGSMLLLLLACETVDGWFSEGASVDDEVSALCEDYCSRAQGVCPDVFVDDDTCFDACLDMDMNGQTNDRSGDTVQCRITALELGLCEHAGVDSALCSSDDEHTGQLPDDSAVQ